LQAELPTQLRLALVLLDHQSVTLLLESKARIPHSTQSHQQVAQAETVSPPCIPAMLAVVVVVLQHKLQRQVA
jgi:hypothetical protein